MKTNEILQGNRILAEFMGFTPLNKEHTVFSSNDFLYEREQETNWFDRDLKFHTSWDWLMPVVEKILNICQESDEMEEYYIITDAIPDITSVFTACVKFAEWYKNQAK